MSVHTSMSVSVDGYIAGPHDSAVQPLGQGGKALFDWFYTGDQPSAFYPDFRMSAASREVFDGVCARNGAIVAGRRTYDIVAGWGGSGPQRDVPLVVLTHDPPKEPFDYDYVSGIEAAVARARELAGDKDVSLMGSGPVRGALQAGLLDEIHLHVAPVLLGGGVRLIDALPATLELLDVVAAPGVTHLSYRVAR